MEPFLLCDSNSTTAQDLIMEKYILLRVVVSINIRISKSFIQVIIYYA